MENLPDVREAPKVGVCTKNLREKLLAAMLKVGGIAKKGENEKQNYRFQRAADIFESTQKAFGEAGIAFLAHELEARQLESHKTANGATVFVWLVKMNYRLMDTDNSGEILDSNHSGIGFDTSDKGLNKARTAALKYFLKQTLLIGEDEDDGDRETIAPSEHEELNKRQADHAKGFEEGRGYERSLAAPQDDFLGDPSPTPTSAKKTRLKAVEAPQEVAHGDEPISVVAQESIKVQCKELGVTVQEICEQCQVTELDQITQNQYAAIQRIFDRKRKNRGKAKAD